MIIVPHFEGPLRHSYIAGTSYFGLVDDTFGVTVVGDGAGCFFPAVTS